MRRYLVPLGFILAAAISITLWMFLPKLGDLGENMQKGGPLVAALIMLIILQTSFIVERLLSLRKAQGRGSLPEFLNAVRKRLHNGDVDGAIKICARAAWLGGQRHSRRARALPAGARPTARRRRRSWPRRRRRSRKRTASRCRCSSAT